jgi:hypothetical protein
MAEEEKKEKKKKEKVPKWKPIFVEADLEAFGLDSSAKSSDVENVIREKFDMDARPRAQVSGVRTELIQAAEDAGIKLERNKKDKITTSSLLKAAVELYKREKGE